jgi:dTDP-D-glucose 4,6-dehydratase
MWPIVKRILDGRSYVVVPGDGTSTRPICYTANAAQQVLLAVDREEAVGEVFHSVDQSTYCIADIVRIIAEELHHQLEVVPIAHPLAQDLARGFADGGTSLLDSSKLTYLLGYRDLVPPDEALGRTARWIVDHLDEIDEEQINQLVPNPYAYETEDKLVASYRTWSAEAEAAIPRPETQRALSPQFRAMYRPPPDQNE